jgi:rhomboid protease GluP
LKKSNSANWRSIEALPRRAEGSSWALKLGNSLVENVDESRITKEAQKWNPYRSILVAAPTSRRLLPLVRIGRFRKAVIARNYLLIYMAGVAWGMLAIFAAIVAYINVRPATGFFSAAFALAALALIFDARQIRNSQHTLFERSLFAAWLKTSKKSRVGLILWIVLLCITGITQLRLNSTLGGWEPAAIKYGAIIKLISAGEWWRIITGPYFHSNVAHFAGNVVMAVYVGPIAFALVGWRSLIIFFVANSVGAIAFVIFGSSAFEVYMGISPGILALFSTLFAIGVRRPRFLPRGMANFFIAIALVSALGSEALSSSSASAAHIAGILLGVIAGATGWLSAHNFKRDQKNRTLISNHV